MLTSSREPSHLRNKRALDLINPNSQCEVPLPHQTAAHLLAWGPSMISPETKSINLVRVSEMSYRDTGEVKSTDTSDKNHVNLSIFLKHYFLSHIK